jgi:hypothetical protein
MDVLELAKNLGTMNEADLRAAAEATFCNDAISIQGWQVSFQGRTLQASYQASPVSSGDTLLGAAATILSADLRQIYCSGMTMLTGGPPPAPGTELAARTTTMLYTPSGNNTTVTGWATGVILRADGSNCLYFYQQSFTVG